jgi:C-terminal processing protease CtpA/Prc
VGTTSFGKGIAQSYGEIEGLTGKVIDTEGNEITYNYGVYLTIAYYYSPDRVNIQGIGYTPQEENIIADYLGQMERSIELLGG